MSLSIFDLFKIGVGPSSSHTVGPMVAANRFVEQLCSRHLLTQIAGVRIGLYGSLAMTGKGHATDTAVLLGLQGERPDLVDPLKISDYLQEIRTSKSLKLADLRRIPFSEAEDLRFYFTETLPKHPNGMRFQALDASGIILQENIYYSVGGGFVLSDEEFSQSAADNGRSEPLYPFNNGAELLAAGEKSGLSIAQLQLANELSWHTEAEIERGLTNIWNTMHQCIEAGCQATGLLPGELKIRRRANHLLTTLNKSTDGILHDQLMVLDWVNLFAMAVNEENAAGGRVVTAPTNGAAGVIPAVLAYYHRFIPSASQQGIFDFLATAAAIGALYKKNASISAAEVGCQGEIGVACSMAAGALCAVLGGTNQQVENAAEIGMEHNLGLTCDPIAGLVQVPCIERNTMGAIKAINAARLALHGDGKHHVSLDSVIETMRQTGLDMQDKYKETSTGGLAVNVVAC
ncbi:L-serine ammonia-lyase [Nitrincola sp. MINF-07-Sa-05]|uniref:L-serine ammonia-lyase n=1 Tax=Nitrincola salilacus TaxID=3400273 RepID=UPI003917C42D